MNLDFKEGFKNCGCENCKRYLKMLEDGLVTEEELWDLARKGKLPGLGYFRLRGGDGHPSIVN